MFKKYHSNISIIALALVCAACRISTPPEAESEKGGLSVELEIRSATLARSAASVGPRPTDSASIRVSGPGMETRIYGFGIGQKFSLTDLSPGPSRRFEVSLLNHGRLLYAGAAETTLYADRKNSIFLHCLPRFSRVAATVHLPLDFPKTVASGEMRLMGGGDTLSTPMVRSGEFLFFTLEEVPGDRDFRLTLDLRDGAGAAVANGEQPVLHVPMGTNLAVNIPLTTTFSQLQFGMDLANPQQTSLSFSFPAGRRIPGVFGEVVFSELYPAPAYEDSSSLGEWFELFNRTSDTLDLTGCKVARDGGGSTTKQAILPVYLLPPGKALVIGRGSMVVADLHFSSFSLTNALAAMEFSCGDGATKLDSLTYSMSIADSTVIPVRDGKVTMLRPDKIAERLLPTSWCMVPAHPMAGQGIPTPGTMENGCAD